MPADTPITFVDGALAAADLNAGRNLLRYISGFTSGSKPFARVRSSVSVALTNDGDWSPLTFDTDVFNRGETPLFDGGAPTLFTIPENGFYLCGACVRTDATTANKALRIQLEGSTIVQHDNIGVSTPAFTTMNVSTLFYAETGNEVTADVFQDSGGTIDAIVEGLASPVFWCAWYAIDAE